MPYSKTHLTLVSPHYFVILGHIDKQILRQQAAPPIR